MTFAPTSTTTQHLMCVYRPPSSEKKRVLTFVFLSEMQDLIGQFKSKTLNFMIIGDFNYHFDSNISADAAKARDLLAENDLQPLVNFPTHRAQHLIDWVIAPKSGNSIKLIDVTTKSVSDQAIITIDMAFSKPSKLVKTVTSRRRKAIDLDQIKSDVRSALPDPNSITLETFNSMFRYVLDVHAPLTTRTLTERPISPWFCLIIIKAKQIRRRAERRLNKTKLTAHAEIYKAARNEVT
ncbi:hypothetical protein ElyMa_001219600 [Elysia marginata]|uniref:Endonuclease/exonuclease/phosphatase domain-containing protein n=1 Tax=Elysia marginata TaxID=1093978 RepID=A0AAV4IB31_9GAST|nr:hypothetical protein ElyMa_001219600 [Elysia marginata]